MRPSPDIGSPVHAAINDVPAVQKPQPGQVSLNNPFVPKNDETGVLDVIHIHPGRDSPVGQAGEVG